MLRQQFRRVKSGVNLETIQSVCTAYEKKSCLTSCLE